ncbi:MAG: hypothetical protein ACFB8W_00215 [Elainellaceae cyanobacterium]
MREKLPFLVGLSSDERRRLPKISRKSQAFTYQALDVATQHPELMPRYLDVDGAMRDMNLFIAVLQVLSELEQMVKDTQSIAGSEAYAAARKAYMSVKKDGQNIGLDEVIDSLSRYFERSHPTTLA